MSLQTVLSIAVVCLMLGLFFNFVKKLGLIESDLKSGVLKFSTKNNFYLRPCFFIEPVVSQDGLMYKFHLLVVISSNKKFSITNWKLKIHKLYNGTFRQYYFRDTFGNRLPKGVSVLSSDKNQQILGLEFVPQGKYLPYNLYLGTHKAELVASTEKGKFIYKFKFIVQDRNLKDHGATKKQAMENRRATAFELPLLD